MHIWLDRLFKASVKKFEVLSAMAFSLGNAAIELPAPQYILDVCGSLVEERSDRTLAFIHASVKE